MSRRPTVRVRSLAFAACLLTLGFGLTVAGCGGGDPSEHIDRPLVIAFSPLLSPIDFATLQQNPTYTDDKLTVSIVPQYPGEIVIFFQDDTEIDPASVFLGGDPTLGVDPNAVVVLHFVPGTGNVELPLAKVIVEKDRIRLLPDALWNLDVNGDPVADAAGVLDPGQYSIGVFDNVRNTRGRELQESPVFHSFTVGSVDVDGPTIIATVPVDGDVDVGAGVPPPVPTGATGVADIRTNIFGPTSQPVVIRFNEGIASNSVTPSNIKVEDAGAFVPGGGAPPQIPPAAGYPKLKSVEDGATLPSNGHEIVWKPSEQAGGFPFGTTIRVTLTGLYNDAAAEAADPLHLAPQNPSPVRDLTGNGMLVNFEFSFHTITLPDFPANPFPEYAIYWSGSDRVGVIDTINQNEMGVQFVNAAAGQPTDRVPANALPPRTDSILNAQYIPGFDPTEISVDARTNGATCHSFIYVMSSSSSEIVIANTRTTLPVAILKTPTPGGISVQTGGGQSANVLCVTNSSANTLTVFNVANITPGAAILGGPIFVQKVTTTGNTPRAITITISPTGQWSRDPGYGGPATPLLMYIDLTDGVVNTKALSADQPGRKFTLGASSSPNDVSLTMCFAPCMGCPVIMYGAISQGGDGPFAGKVTYYVAGPGCTTGSSTAYRPDALIGDVGGFDAPAGLDEVLSLGVGALFGVAESGSQANAVTMVGTIVGNVNLPLAPEITNQFRNVGANPVALAHRGAWAAPCIGLANSGTCFAPPPPASCVYEGTEQLLVAVDGSLGVSQDMYVCARGAGLVQVINMTSGARAFDSPVLIPSVRYVGSQASQ